MKQTAKTDYTYCVNEKCKNKCERHVDNYNFKEDELYSFCDFECKDEELKATRKVNGVDNLKEVIYIKEMEE